MPEFHWMCVCYGMAVPRVRSVLCCLSIPTGCVIARYNRIYYTALVNAVECSIYLNGPSQRSTVSYFHIFDCCKAYFYISLLYISPARHHFCAEPCSVQSSPELHGLPVSASHDQWSITWLAGCWMIWYRDQLLLLGYPDVDSEYFYTEFFATLIFFTLIFF